MPLEEALQELARQGAVQILFLSNVAEGRRSREIEGQFTLSDAIARLLAGTGLDYRVINDRTVEVRPAAASPASEVRAARAAVGAAEELAEVRVTAEQLVATRVPTPLQDIPQSISVVSAEQIRQQNSADLWDVMGNATGMALRSRSSLGGHIYARGHRIMTLQVDGGPGLDLSIPDPHLLSITTDLSGFERVEILRGSNALFTGNSNPGGTVSLERKRPLPTSRTSLSLIAGSWNSYRFEADITGPIADVGTREGSLRGRAVGLYARNDYFYDFADSRRKKILGVVEYDVLPEATLTAGASYFWEDATPWEGGVPFFDDGGDVGLSRSTAHVPNWAFSRTRIGEAYVQYRQRFADTWNLKFNVAAWRPDLEYAYVVHLSPVSRTTQRLGEPTMIFTGRPSRFRQVSTDVTLTGTFNWFGKRQELAIGGDWMRVWGEWDTFNQFLEAGPPLYDDFDPAAYPDPRLDKDTLFENHATSERKLRGGFASLQFHLNDAWSVTGGLRIGSNKLATDRRFIRNFFVLNAVSFADERSNVITPYAAVMYRINDRYSAYASYADVYRSDYPTARASGGLLAAVHGVTIEVGMKSAWRDGALNGSLAAYETRQENVPIFDENTDFRRRIPFCCYLSTSTRTTGVEIEVNGEAAPGWQVGAGYAHNVARYDVMQDYPLVSPRHSLRLWTNVALPGDLARWSIGGNLRAQTRTVVDGAFRNDAEPNLVQQPYAILDLRTGYEISRDLKAALSVNNVLDKRYYESIEPYNMRGWYGEPRNFAVRIDASF